MKKLGLICLLLLPGMLPAQVYKDFYTDGTIAVGESWGAVRTFDSANLDIYGEVDGILAYDLSIVTLHEGNSVGIIAGYENSTMTVLDSGPDLDVEIYGNSTINLRGGDISSLYIVGGTINFYGTNLQIHDYVSYPDHSNGWVSGLWPNGDSFDFYFKSHSLSNAIDHINLIPEPSVLLLLALGGIFVRKMNK